MSRFIAGFAALLVALGTAQARVNKITILKATPAFKGQAFGKTGAYEIVKGTVTGEIDPADRRNALITDIQFAPRNANGKVAYTATFSLLKPVDVSKASGVVIYDVTNRGNVRFAGRFTKFVLATAPADPDALDPGDGSDRK